MDHSEIERVLEQLNAEREGLQARLATVTTAVDSFQALLEMTPAPAEVPAVTDSAPGQAEVAPVAEAQQVALAVQFPAGEPPRGMEAARLILQSDMTRYWNVKEVSDEQVRRGWAEPRPRGAKGNPPARAALERLKNQYRDNVRVVWSPFLAYRWVVPEPSPSPNGSGAARAEEVAS